MDAVLKAEFDRFEEDLLETYKIALKNENKEIRQKNLLNLMEELQTIKQDYLCCDNAMTVAKQKSTVEEYEQTYENEYKNGAKALKKVKNLKEYKKFQTQLNEISAKYSSTATTEEASEASTSMEAIEALPSEININDPITKLPMTIPVRNKLCGHYYNKDTICSFIKTNRKVRCPVVGCANTKFIKKEDLIEDANMMLHIQQLQNTPK